jgi:hypothetical protein
MPESNTTIEAPTTSLVESPPPAPIPVRDPAPDPRAQLNKLAAQLIRANNRRLLVEYLRLRRAMR